MSVDKFKFVCINGDIENSAYRRIDGEISSLIEQGSRNFVFVLKDINYLDSAAAGILINTLYYVQKENGSLFIIAHGEKTRGVLTMAGFHHFIKIFSSKDEFLEIRG